MKNPQIFEIKRFAVHDGDGIRTTVFFKGCPLKCVWCHNPEGLSAERQLAYYENKCINCGECVVACPNNAHKTYENGHFFDRDKCVFCGKCADACLADALMLFGKEYSVNELLSILIEDKEFYENSGGGVTLSGGECLLYPDFCAELLKELKKQNINTAVDTCGFVSKESLEKVLPYTDTFLYDIKAIDNDVHIKCTGQSNGIILENLKYIDSLGKKTEIRIPFVPCYNDNQIEKIGDFITTLNNVVAVRVLPYHNFAASKYLSLDTENALPIELPSAKEINNAKDILKSKNINVKE